MKLFLFLSLISLSSFASFDFKYGSNIRSYPSLGGDLHAELGHNITLWGDTNNNSPLFGLIRTSFNASTSVVVQNYDAKVTLYPISFIGFGAGHKEYDSNYKEFTYYDCEDEVRCKGQMKKDYSFAKIALGAGGFLGTYTYTEYRNSYEKVDERNLGVGEYEHIIIASPEHEKEIQKTSMLAYKLDQDLVGIVHSENRFQNSNKLANLSVAFYRKNFENIYLTLGVGSLHTEDVDPGTIFVLRVHHILIPSKALF